jgi:O-6-methylguanine DNA methyltransferase
VKPSKKAFLWSYEKDGQICLNLKCDPEWRDFWRNTYDAVIPGYHQNKEHWNTVILDGTIPDDDVKRMIAESYDLVTDSPTKRIYEAVKRIPRGKVATYGQVAAMAGNPKMSRAVGNALHKNPDFENIPCYRVVNSKGELAGEYVFGGAWAQKELLEADGIVVQNGKVDLSKFGMDINNIKKRREDMVKHIILWTLKDELSAEEKEQVKLGIKEGLEGLAGKIPGMIDIKVNINGLASSNADLMLDSTFESEEALKGYAVHPEHVAVADGKVRPYTKIRSCLDFEI